MKPAKTIDMARALLRDGNAGAYARVLAGAIRATTGKRAAALRAAIVEDDATRFFINLNSKCPLAKV